jgi:integrase
MKGIFRQQKRPVRPAAALTSTEIEAMLRTCGDDLAGLRDKALLLTGFAGGLRRSELVAPDVQDIRYTKDGMVLRIRSSKVDQDGQGADVGISQGSHPGIRDLAVPYDVVTIGGWLQAQPAHREATAGHARIFSFARCRAVL